MLHHRILLSYGLQRTHPKTPVHLHELAISGYYSCQANARGGNKLNSSGLGLPPLLHKVPVQQSALLCKL
jgi:hypothetical protein